MEQLPWYPGERKALLVLVRCRSYLYSRQRDVARTYLVFDIPTTCARGYHHENVRVLIVEQE